MFKRFKSIHHNETIISIIVIILLFTGIVPSLISSDWTWFSRSGALIVVFGIYFVWLDYKSDINQNLDTIFSGFKDYLKDTEDNLKPKEINTIEQEVRSKFDEVSVATENRSQNIEFSILVIGTLIWGYGDLINKIDFESFISKKKVQQIEHNKTLERNK